MKGSNYELIRIQNKKPVKSLEEFYKQWLDDEQADELFDFIMQERKERRGKTRQ